MTVVPAPSGTGCDSLAEAAAIACRMPIGAIRLLDDDAEEQDVLFAAALEHGDLFEVQDLLQDSRFAASGMVARERRLRFFAAVPIRQADGAIIAFLHVADHIPRLLTAGERRILETLASQAAVQIDLQQQLDQLRSLFNGSRDIIYETDANGFFTYINAAALHTMGYEQHQLLGRHFLEVIPEAWRPRMLEIYRTQRAALIPWSYHEFPCLTGSGDEVWLGQSEHAVIRDGRLVAYQMIARDITEIRAAQEALRDAARQKAEFLANMSHELRTPMNGILGMLELLLDSNLGSDQRDLASTAHSSAESLLVILNDLIDFAQVDAGRLLVDKRDFDVRAAIRDVLDLVAEQAHGKGIEVGCAIDPAIPNRLRGDAGRLRQILLNLVGNAVKFTSQGKVNVRVAPDPKHPGTPLLRFRVIDTGIGIPESEWPRLFDPFVQIDGSTTRRFGGVGLGLAMSSRLVKLMGGEIGVESAPGHGSTFWFTVRLERAEESGGPELRLAPALRVLLVDDDATARLLMAAKLKGWGIAADDVSDGISALGTLRAAAAAGRRFDVVVTDLEMQGLHGLALSRIIKADAQLGSPRVIVLSATSPSSGSVVRECGVSSWLAKPVNDGLLRGALFGETPAAEPAREAPGRKILVVEDNDVNQKVVLRQLRTLGYAADCVSNGLEAVAAFERSAYDLILMDCFMPEMDGFHATEEIRRREQDGKRTPIVALTASALESDRQACFTAGMDDFMSKPLRQSDLAGVLQRWIGQPEPCLQNTTAAQAPALDLHSVGLDNLNDDAFIASLLEIYLEQADGLFADAARAVEKNDDTGFLFAVHALNGSSRNIGAIALSRICTTTEEALRAGKQLCLRTALDLIRSRFEEVRRETASLFVFAPETPAIRQAV